MEDGVTMPDRVRDHWFTDMADSCLLPGGRGSSPRTPAAPARSSLPGRCGPRIHIRFNPGFRARATVQLISPRAAPAHMSRKTAAEEARGIAARWMDSGKHVRCLR